MDGSVVILEWLLDHLSGVAVGTVGLILISYIVARPPLVQARKLAYRIDRSDDNAVNLASICCANGRQDLEHGHRLRRALKNFDLAVYTLAPRQDYSGESRRLYRECRDWRALAYEQSGLWTEAVEDLVWLTQDQSTQPHALRAHRLRRLATAKDHLNMHAEAQLLREQAELYEKKAAVPATASEILQMWPDVEYLVLKPVSDSEQLNRALANIKALADINDADANAIYGQALLELKAGDPSAISSLTKAAALMPPDFVNVYYWRARARAAAGEFQGCLEDCERASSAAPLLSSVRYLQGFARFALGQFEKAIEGFSQATEAEPSWREANQGLVLARARLRQWKQVTVDCDRALMLGIEDPVILAARGEADLNLGHLDQALVDCTRALEDFAPTIYACRVRGVTHLKLQQWVAADRDLTAALKLDEQDAISLAYRAEARRMQGNNESAREDADLALSYAENLTTARLVRVLIALKRWEIERKQELLDAADSDSARIVGAEPTSASGYWAQALVRRARGKADEALFLATQALNHDSAFASAYRTRGELYFSRSDWRKAAVDFHSAIACGGPADRGESYFLLAECQRLGGEPQLAIETYGESIVYAPNYAWTDYGRGLAYLATGNRSKSLENYTSAIAKGLFVPEVFRARAQARFECGLDEDANRDFAEAAKFEMSPIRTFLEWGAVMVFTGKVTEGVSKFSETLTLDPNSDEAYARRGWARGVAGDLDGALEDEKKAIELNSMSATHFNNRAWVLCKRERWSDAVNDCDLALKLDKSLDYALKNRSFARWCLGRKAEALGDLGEMVRLCQSEGRAPATSRGDLFNWKDQARDWARVMVDHEGDSVGNLGWGIALWMSGQAGSAEEKIRRAIGIDPQLQTGLDVLAGIDELNARSHAIRETPVQ